jgi:repressor LexA
MLTRKQHELLLYIDKHLSESGVSPSFEEMKDALDLKSKSGVHRLISALEERGFIRRLANRARALEVLKMPEMKAAVPANSGAPLRVPQAANDLIIDLPLHGRIAAGTPIEALQGTDTLPVPAALLGPGEHYALEVAGDSMVDEGILDGDFALIRKVDTARDGEIVVALIDNEEATLKTFRREGSMVRLDPANRQYEPQRYDPRRVQIQGRLAGLIRRY